MADPNTPVDSAGRVISVGDNVDITGGKVIGFRSDPSNRLNVWVLPKLNTIRTINPTDAINRKVDGKAILVSGYNCVSSAPAVQDIAPTDAPAPVEGATPDTQAAPADNTLLPSNFLAPSIS